MRGVDGGCSVVEENGHAAVTNTKNETIPYQYHESREISPFSLTPDDGLNDCHVLTMAYGLRSTLTSANTLLRLSQVVRGWIHNNP